MSKKHSYEVTVSNVGTVYTGKVGTKAKRAFDECVEKSKKIRNECSREDVILLKDGSPIEEYIAQHCLSIDELIVDLQRAKYQSRLGGETVPHFCLQDHPYIPFRRVSVDQDESGAVVLLHPVEEYVEFSQK